MLLQLFRFVMEIKGLGFDEKKVWKELVKHYQGQLFLFLEKTCIIHIVKLDFNKSALTRCSRIGAGIMYDNYNNLQEIDMIKDLVKHVEVIGSLGIGQPCHCYNTTTDWETYVIQVGLSRGVLRWDGAGSLRDCYVTCCAMGRKPNDRLRFEDISYLCTDFTPGGELI